MEQIDGMDKSIEVKEKFGEETYIFRFNKSNYNSGKAYISMTNMSKLEEDIRKIVK